MKIVIIGASHSGLITAIDLKKLNPAFEVLLIDSQTESELGYISNGINLYFQGYIKNLNEAVFDLSQLTVLGVDLMTETRVTKIDPGHKTIDYQRLTSENKFSLAYDKLIIATGSSANKQLMAQQEYENIVSYKNLSESQVALPKLKEAQRIAIISGGYIGVELANILHQQGKEIHLIDSMDDILFRYFDSEMVQVVETAMQEQGVHYHPREFAVKYQTKGTVVEAVRLMHETIPVDLIVSPKNLFPNTALLQDISDLNEDWTVKVDEYLQTSQPDVYAIGDIVPIQEPNEYFHVFMPLVNRALRMGRVLALNLAGYPTKFVGTEKTTLTQVFGYFLGSCGMIEDEGPFQGIKTRAYTAELPLKTRAVEETDVPMVKAKIIFEAETELILGIQLVGQQNMTEELNLACVALKHPTTLAELATQLFSFSPNLTDRFHFLNQLAFDALLDNQKNNG